MGLFSAKHSLLMYEAQKLPTNGRELMKFILQVYWLPKLLQFLLEWFAILTLVLRHGQQIVA